MLGAMLVSSHSKYNLLLLLVCNNYRILGASWSVCGVTWRRAGAFCLLLSETVLKVSWMHLGGAWMRLLGYVTGSLGAVWGALSHESKICRYLGLGIPGDENSWIRSYVGTYARIVFIGFVTCMLWHFACRTGLHHPPDPPRKGNDMSTDT